MNALSFIGLLKIIYGKKLPDLNKIQKKGLLAVKIAQHFALRVDFLDENVCRELMKLFRNNNSIAEENVFALIDSYTTKDWIDNFSSFSKKPFAAASVGQVHNAQLKSGENVVVKIIKRNFKDQFLKDIDKLVKFFKFIIFFYPKLKKVFDPISVLEYIKEYTINELNLDNEIQGITTLKTIALQNSFCYDFSSLAFPNTFPALSNQNLLVSSLINGKTFDELLDEKLLPYEMLMNLFKIHGFYLFKVGKFHGDIHPGNIILGTDGKIYFIDCGAISQVGKKIRSGLFFFLDSLSNYDYESCVIYLNQMALNGIERQKLQNFRLAFMNLYLDFKGKNITQVSLTKKMMDTIKLAVNHGMEFEKGMFAIIKSMMYLDGMVLRCNPDAVLLEDMQPVLNEFKKIMISENDTKF
jgi:ubiquinone biosynthesis protein